MLPFLIMRLYDRNNFMALQPFIEKIKSGQLTLKNILEEDEIFQKIQSQGQTFKKYGKISFVDLASSERLKETHS